MLLDCSGLEAWPAAWEVGAVLRRQEVLTSRGDNQPLNDLRPLPGYSELSQFGISNRMPFDRCLYVGRNLSG